MNGREFWALRGLSDDALQASLGKLLGAGARLEARIVAHLAEVEERRLHLLAGYSSLYDYCRKRLALSDYEAFARIAAARVARKYPLVFELLEQRRLHLTAICVVREFLTPENHRELLKEISGQSKLQIRETLARRFPRDDARTSLKKLPALDPLSPGRYRLVLTLSAEQKEKLELARDLLSHANPSGDLTTVVERALDALVTRLEKRRFGQRQAKPKPSMTVAQTMIRVSSTSAKAAEHDAKAGEADVRAEALGRLETSGTSENAVGEHVTIASPNVAMPYEAMPYEAMPIVARNTSIHERAAPKINDLTATSRGRQHIRHAVRRELVARDGARCSFVSADGTCCRERGFLQFHHRQAWACGGADTPENLALLCRAHNRLLAERDFGKAHVRESIDNRQQNHARHDRGRHLGQPRRAK